MSVKPGDPLTIKARDWNPLLGVAEAARRNTLNLQSGQGMATVPSGVVVPLKNGTGSKVSRYHAMGIGDPLTSPTDNEQSFLNQLAFDGETMASAYLGKFAIMQEVTAAGKIGMGLINGVSVAEITVDDADHTHVDTDTAGGSKLVSGMSGGAQIIWKQTGTGTKWAIVRIGGGGGGTQKKPYCRFTLDAALGTGEASESATIESQWGYGTDHDDTATITVNNLLTHTAGTYVFEGDSGDAGIAVYDPDDDDWYIIQMECP